MGSNANTLVKASGCKSQPATLLIMRLNTLWLQNKEKSLQVRAGSHLPLTKTISKKQPRSSDMRKCFPLLLCLLFLWVWYFLSDLCWIYWPLTYQFICGYFGYLNLKAIPQMSPGQLFCLVVDSPRLEGESPVSTKGFPWTHWNGFFSPCRKNSKGSSTPWKRSLMAKTRFKGKCAISAVSHTWWCEMAFIKQQVLSEGPSLCCRLKFLIW